ncbi:hypothetical protein F5Y16DRAFT_87867 [Xylariaceae sp. FL0255]|nr:hypothetical protein F5Y16DRAFT_87867 [Xylariaceae sp. FL0255]
MDFSPPALVRSPTSSRHPSRSPGLDYHSPDHTESFYRIVPTYGLACASFPAAMDADHSLPYLDGTTSAGWSEATLIHSAPSAGGPGILSSEYAPYAGYDTTIHPSYSHDMYSTHMSNSHVLAHASMPSRSPAYLSASPTPRIKMESHDYASGAEHSQYSSPRSSHATVLEPSSYESQIGGSDYLSDAPVGSWPKSDHLPVDADPYYAGPAGSSSTLASDRQQQTPRASRAPKRQPRKLTSKEEANFQCEVDGCGKLFSRSYNYKAHMETHDKKREYPFVCTVDDCDKKFVRKTDLQRHHQSVHMKEKNHKCDYCGRLFARKDTLRRHMEDGCSKRFDIGTVDVRGGTDNYDAYGGSSRPLASSSGHLMAPSAQLPPMTLPRVISRSDHHTYSRK